MSRTHVHYIIPADGDEADHPNVVSIAHPSDGLRLKHLRKAFPVPGTYHFRCKFKWKSTFVWLDLSDDHGILPAYDGRVSVKAARIKRCSKGGGGGDGARARRGGGGRTGGGDRAAAAGGGRREANRGRAQGMNGGTRGTHSDKGGRGSSVGPDGGPGIVRRDSDVMFSAFADDPSGDGGGGLEHQTSAQSLLHMDDPSAGGNNEGLITMDDDEAGDGGGEAGGNLLDISMDATTPRAGGGTDMSDLWS
jgi:hypothetical protein